MEFTLYYQGTLKANGTPTDKHNIRKVFHKQLKELWNQIPLKYCHDLKRDLEKEINGIKFIPLVSDDTALTTELDITLLRPGKPGSIIMDGGDIDNRLKTLFDALRVPQTANEIPKGYEPEGEEKPFYCLLEDDSLIEKVSIKTDKLLEKTEDPTHVKMFIHVTTKKYVNSLATSDIP